MQLQLTLDERQLVANILQNRHDQRLTPLFDKIIARDLCLDCDELDELAALLSGCAINDACGKALLSRVIDKVNEARVMA